MENDDLKQTRITKYYKPCKGPLEFNCKPATRRRIKKRRSKRQRKMESPDSDVEFVEETVKLEPVSPCIVLEGEYERIEYSSNGVIESPLKKPKVEESNAENINITNISITKSQGKTCYEVNKTSKTFQMCVDTCSSSNSSCTVNVKEEKFELRNYLNANDTEIEEITLKITNLMHLLSTIITNTERESCFHLLSRDEQNVLESLSSMNVLYKFVCCKLFSHQIKWYNVAKFLNSVRLPMKQDKIHEMIYFFKTTSLIETDYTLESLPVLLNLLYSNDVKAIAKDLKLNAKSASNNYKEAIIKCAQKQTTLNPRKSMDLVIRQMIYNKLGVMFKISPCLYTTMHKIHLLYSFPISGLKLPSDLYRTINEIKYGTTTLPNYQLSEDRIFKSSQDFSHYYKAYSYKDELLQEFEKKSLVNMIKLCQEMFKEFQTIITDKNVFLNTKGGFLNRFTAGSKYASALAFGAEKLSAKYPVESKTWIKLILSQRFFTVRKKSLLYVQLAIIYKKLGNIQKAVKTLTTALKDENLGRFDTCELIYKLKSYTKDDESLRELQDVINSAPKPELFPTITIDALSVNANEPLYKYVTRTGDIEYLRVEDVAIRHYIDCKGFKHGIHCEGSLMVSMFLLLFWDIIFAKRIPYTFVSPIQKFPLDMHSKDFYETRKDMVDRRLIQLRKEWSDEELIVHFENAWKESVDTIASDAIKTLGDQIVIDIIKTLGRKVVAGICERLAMNYDECTAGMPDLFLWSSSKCKFVEVKGPGDKLSTKQKLWIDYLLKIGGDAEVCHVRRIGSKK